MSRDSAELARFQRSAVNSGLFSTRLIGRLDQLADAGDGDLARLTDEFADEFPKTANVIRFVLAATTRGYEIVREIGHGGMAVVFEVVNPKANDRREALKWLRIRSEGDVNELTARFEREVRYLQEVKKYQARFSQKFNTPHLVEVYNTHQTEGGVFVTMELLNGRTLRELVDETGPVALPTALDYTGQISDGLSALHNLGIIHRDVKPSNIFLEKSGRVVLLDLGVAKRATDTDLTKIDSAVGLAIGTLAYSSPQRLTNSTLVSESDDVYSLGCVLYYLLTGEHAFGDAAGGYPAAVLAHSRPQRPHLPRRQTLWGVQHDDQPVVPIWVDTLFQRMIATEQANRFPNSKAFDEKFRQLRSRLASLPEVIAAFVGSEIQSRFGDLTPDDQPNPFSLPADGLREYDAALAKYLKYLREEQLAVSPVPLVRAGTLTKLEIKEVFVEIDLLTKDTESRGAETHAQVSQILKPTLTLKAAPVPKSNPTKEILARLFPHKAAPSSRAGKGRAAKSAAQHGDDLTASLGGDLAAGTTNRSGPVIGSGLGGVLSQNRMLVFRGPPGGGKTTLLKRAALAFAEARSRDLPGWTAEDGDRIPIFLRLRSYAAFLQPDPTASRDRPRIVEYLADYYESLNLPPDFFNRFLETEGCAVFMDGVDEVPQSLREVVARHVAEFVRRYGGVVDAVARAGEEYERSRLSRGRPDEGGKGPQSRPTFAATVDPVRKRDNLFVVASRPKGYDAVKEFLTEQFKVYDVKPLGLLGIHQLLDNVLQIIEPNFQKQVKNLADLFKAVKNSRELTILAGTPLFCTALVLVYLYRAAELPKRRVDVIEEIVDLLLGFWKAEDWKPLRNMPVEDLEPALGDLKAEVSTRKKRLSHIAMWMQQSEKRTEIKEKDAVTVLADFLRQKEPKLAARAEAIAKQFLQKSHQLSGILVEMEPDVFAFTHEGIREYLIAQSLTNMREAAFVEEVFAHIDDPVWEEVILLAGATAGLPDGTREHLLDECLRHARECRAERKGEKWARRLVIAGKMAYDMGEYLAPGYQDELKAVLGQEALDPDNELKHRSDVALALDDIGWLTNTPYACVPVGGGRVYLGKNLVTTHQYQRFLNAVKDDHIEDSVKRAWWERPYCVTRGGDPYPDIHDESVRWYELNRGDKHIPKSWSDPKFGIAHRGIPVVGISWFEANAYCKWLEIHWADLDEATANDGLRPKKIRLPTEAEWQSGVFGSGPVCRFPWSDEASDGPPEAHKWERYANTGKVLEFPTPVGLFPLGTTRPQGLADACGNVWEWQANEFDESYRGIALRGGAYTTGAADAGCDLRGWREPAGRDTDLGFRILVEV